MQCLRKRLSPPDPEYLPSLLNLLMLVVSIKISTSLSIPSMRPPDWFPFCCVRDRFSSRFVGHDHLFPVSVDASPLYRQTSLKIYSWGRPQSLRAWASIYSNWYWSDLIAFISASTSDFCPAFTSHSHHGVIVYVSSFEGHSDNHIWQMAFEIVLFGDFAKHLCVRKS